VLLVQRFFSMLPEEQRPILSVGNSQVTVQDALRIIFVTIELKLLESFGSIVRRPDTVVFVEYRFTRRQLPVLLGGGMQAQMLFARDEESQRGMQGRNRAPSEHAQEESSRKPPKVDRILSTQI
jgi:hypothetical protein